MGTFFDRSSPGAANGLLKWRGVGAESNIACPVPSSKAWHHIVGKQEGTAASLYVDGVLCASGPLPAIGNAASSISIGRHDSVGCYHYFTGQIDEVRIYNRALSDTEISQLFTSSDSRPSSKRVLTGPLVGYWKLDEPDRKDVCIDSSGNGNTGVAHGTSVVDGMSNRARSFNGKAEYIDLPPLNIHDAITVSAWVYSDNFVQNGFVVTKNPVNTQWALFFEVNGLLKWRSTWDQRNSDALLLRMEHGIILLVSKRALRQACMWMGFSAHQVLCQPSAMRPVGSA